MYFWRCIEKGKSNLDENKINFVIISDSSEDEIKKGFEINQYGEMIFKVEFKNEKRYKGISREYDRYGKKKYFMVNLKMEINFMELNIIYMEREKNS